MVQQLCRQSAQHKKPFPGNDCQARGTRPAASSLTPAHRTEVQAVGPCGGMDASACRLWQRLANIARAAVALLRRRRAGCAHLLAVRRREVLGVGPGLAPRLLLQAVQR